MHLFERTQGDNSIEYRHPSGLYFNFTMLPGTTEDLYLAAIRNCGVWTKLPQLLNTSIAAKEWGTWRKEMDTRWPVRPSGTLVPNTEIAKESKFFDDARKTIDRIHRRTWHE